MLNEKRRYDVGMSRQEGSMMRHLANAYSVTDPAGIIYRMAFSVVWQDRTDKVIVHWIGCINAIKMSQLQQVKTNRL